MDHRPVVPQPPPRLDGRDDQGSGSGAGWLCGQLYDTNHIPWRVVARGRLCSAGGRLVVAAWPKAVFQRKLDRTRRRLQGVGAPVFLGLPDPHSARLLHHLWHAAVRTVRRHPRGVGHHRGGRSAVDVSFLGLPARGGALCPRGQAPPAVERHRAGLVLLLLGTDGRELQPRLPHLRSGAG